MQYKKQTMVGISVGIVAIVVAFFTYTYLRTAPIEQPAPPAQTQGNAEPKRTDFGAKLPAAFPTNIPVEQGAPVSQSYSLDYASQKQLTIVFPTTKTIKENYALYADFLKKDGWVTMNKLEGNTVSSLYARKDAEGSDINITITKQEVSVSVLKK